MNHFLGLIILVTGMLALQVSRLNNIVNSSSQISISELEVRQDLEQARLDILEGAPSLGFDNLIANWIFLDFLQYFGNVGQRNQVGYTLSPKFFNIIIDRDPRFITPYLYLSHSVSIYAAQPEQAVSLMETGLESLSPNLPPRSYFIWRYKAIDELLFLGDSEAAKNSYEMAANWAEQSSHPDAESVAQASRRTAEFLEENSSSRAAQISSWAQVLVRAVDSYTVQLATERIESLGGTIIVSETGRVSVRYRPDDEP